jgi:hypothetical protein
MALLSMAVWCRLASSIFATIKSNLAFPLLITPPSMQTQAFASDSTTKHDTVPLGSATGQYPRLTPESPMTQPAIDPNVPAWDELCKLTTGWLLNASSPTEERALWQLKLRTRRLYDSASDPNGIAERMLAILSQQQDQSIAA